MAGKHNYVRDANDVEVHGLTATTSTATGITRYYSDLTGKRHWHKGCQDDKQQAIFVHRQWAAGLTRKQVDFKVGKLTANTVRELVTGTSTYTAYRKRSSISSYGR